ncbi:flagellar biosynthetic protein FliQ [Treponema ruminis]|uniref:Flagellar biosynthetic protein FliQ n=1 Tax=Treponema ruminis TaxID=744515 RepID=A0A7W8LLS2_9SPIR|nr:flagellar biosynthesis protein FliQ [Treponema ruminis]MBB5225751.1 flagellar biosynthetic protein FliQ [Treponema ruminis]QSI02441.1 flagellar biosynthetic protein FliQ [Treponema ruminis]
MSVGMIVNLMRGAVFQVFILCAPVLGAALIVGLIVAIFQATTSIQEQTLTFLPKMLVILVVLALLGGWMFSMMGNYTVNLFSQIKNLAR